MAGFEFGSQVNEIVDSLRRNNPELSESARVKHAWNATADQRIAEHVTAVFVVPNTNASEVIVYVDDGIWATELNMQSELMRLNLNMYLNENQGYSQIRAQNGEQVTKLAFKVSKDKYISKERRMSTGQLLNEEEEKYKRAQPVELSDEEISDLNQAFAAIDNDSLRDIAYAAAKANLEWKKGIEKLGA